MGLNAKQEESNLLNSCTLTQFYLTMYQMRYVPIRKIICHHGLGLYNFERKEMISHRHGMKGKGEKQEVEQP